MYLWKSKNRHFVFKGAAFVIIMTFLCAVCPVSSYAVFVYESDGRRDPFVPLVGVAAPVNAASSVTSLSGVALQGIIIGPAGDKSAILNGEMLKEGDSIGSVTVVAITSNKVTVKLGDKTHDLRLYE